jgi:hypothetical protein
MPPIRLLPIRLLPIRLLPIRQTVDRSPVLRSHTSRRNPRPERILAVFCCRDRGAWCADPLRANRGCLTLRPGFRPAETARPPRDGEARLP